MPNLNSDPLFFLSDVSFLTNPQIKPTFLKNTTVILTKDYSKLDLMCEKCLEFFTNGAVANIRDCGLSVYGYNQQTNRYTDLIDGNEWCYIELAGATFDESWGYVMAKDLRMLTKEDYGF